jgi:serine/threonine-protein kinase
MKGNFHMTRLDEASFRRAAEVYHQAISIDSTFAPAYAGLAMSQTMLSSWWGSARPTEVLHAARTAADRAVALDSTLAEAHIARGIVHFYLEWNWDAADRAFRRGVELNPSASFSRILYTTFLSLMGRHEAAVELARGTLERDPLTPAVYNELALVLSYAGHRAQAERLFSEALELDSAFFQTHALSSAFYHRTNQPKKIEPHLARLVRALDGSPPLIAAGTAWLQARTGRQAEARAVLEDLRARSMRSYVPPMAFAMIHAGLGETAEAIEWIDKAYEGRDIMSVWLKIGWWFDPLRADPRFQHALERMRFPAE